MTLKDYNKEMLNIIDEVDKYKRYKNDIVKAITALKVKYKEKSISEDEFKKALKKYTDEKTQRQLIDEYDEKINELLKKILYYNNKIYEELSKEKSISTVEKIVVDKKKHEKYLEELNINKREIKKFIQRQKEKTSEKTIKEEAYSVYRATLLGKIANVFFENITIKLTEKYPAFFKKIYNSIKLANIRVLSNTYISTMLFFSSLVFLITIIISFFLFKDVSILFKVVKAIAVGVIVFIFTFILFYYYPDSVVRSRRRKMKDEIPFLTIHMAAIAGSGAQPISIFKLILESGEYKAIAGEIRRILNYTNLFGYNLLTALRNVANSTPSNEFKELLNGMVASIETGGDLKTYLSEKAEDSLNTYRLERRKFVEAISAYSDVYTGVLIAAPLLFIVTLAIINVIGGNIAGVSVDVIAKIGTFIFIPFLNILFLLFLNIIQPGE